jgi:hypothetical protein
VLSLAAGAVGYGGSVLVQNVGIGRTSEWPFVGFYWTRQAS